MFQKVLFATDFSEYAKKALDCIAGLPGVREILLLHVLEEARSPRGGGEVVETLTETERYLLIEEKHRLESFTKNLKVNTMVTTSSDIPGAIIETAEEQGVSFIIVCYPARTRKSTQLVHVRLPIIHLLFKTKQILSDEGSQNLPRGYS